VTGPMPVVVCGIDDSPGARAALEEAVRLAARRGARVRALLVDEPPEAWSTWSHGPAAVPMPGRQAFHESAVVGHRGRGAVASAFLGSTSLGCVLHAPCPVTVVPLPVPG
jgi:nucleotide-binding universal stress UspA family protein